MFNDEEFGSDSEDDDYIPEGDGQGHDASEEENSGDEEDQVGENGEPKKKRTKKKKEKAKVNHRIGIFSEDQDKTDWNKELLEEKKEAEEIKEKAKLDNLWSDFKSDVGTKPKTTKPKSTGGLGSLFSACSPAPPVTTKQLDSKPKTLLSSLFDTNNDTKDKREEKVKEKPKVKSLLSGLFDEPTNVDSENKVEEEETKSSKIEITNVFDFAGEEVKVTKHVDADSTEAQKYLKKQEEEAAASKTGLTAKRPGGLASVVGQFAKKQKMGCLDKSKLDWNSFVKEEGINEELKTHNKGKAGFVEKQMFLERADLRQFEVEKSMREKVRRQNQQ